MPNWRKVVVSGSAAELSSLTTSGNISSSAYSTGSFGRVEISGDLEVEGSFKSNQKTQAATTTTTLNLAESTNFKITQGTNTTLAVSSTASCVGQTGVIVLIQDATGGRTVALPSEFKTPNGASIVWNIGANNINIISYYVIDSFTIAINYMGDFS